MKTVVCYVFRENLAAGACSNFVLLIIFGVFIPFSVCFLILSDVSIVRETFYYSCNGLKLYDEAVLGVAGIGWLI